MQSSKSITKSILIVILVVLILIVNSSQTYAGGASSAGCGSASSTLSLLDIAKLADIPNCFYPYYICEPVGCGCTAVPPMCYDLVCHTYPAAIVETVKTPFQTKIPFVGTLITELVENMGVWESLLASIAGGTSGGFFWGSGGSQHRAVEGDNIHSNQQFFEAHVMQFLTNWFMEFLNLPFGYRLCNIPLVPDIEVNYLSELDILGWRTGLVDYIAVPSLIANTAAAVGICMAASVSQTVTPGFTVIDLCVGTWGILYPRTGWNVMDSEVVASAMTAYTALRVVANPWMRVVLKPKMFYTLGLLQYAFGGVGKPLMSCIPPGLSPGLWNYADAAAPCSRGFLWIWWQYTCCCKPTTGCVGVLGI